MSAPLLFVTPEDVEVAFYKAIARGDLEAMMAVWAEDEEVSCIHPNGQHLSGLSAVRAGWRQILKPIRKQIEATSVLKWQSMLMAAHQLVETLRLDQKVVGPLLVTHVYLRGSHGWRLACRHCSVSARPESSEMAGRVLH